jgi:DnaJ like chaperone protein
MDIRKLLGLQPREDSGRGGDTKTVRRIVAELEAMEPDRARYLAAFAFILSRVANADLDISEAETREMERIVAERGGLPEAQAVLVVQIAKSQHRLLGATEDFLATREFRAASSREERQALLHCLFAVSAADDTISTVEEEEIRKIASELGLAPNEYLSIRAAYRDKRAVLRDPP